MDREKRLTIAGWGAVSAAGWGVPALYEASCSGTFGEPEVRQRDGAARPVRVRPVPAVGSGARVRHPRLRRASPLVKFAASACVEAIGRDRVSKVQRGDLRLGIVFATMCGAVQYSNRFYKEVLSDPATASPILFPETVFNSASSHLSAILGSQAANYTIVGDSAEFLAALRIARDWLRDGAVDGCLVVGAEELDWVSSEAMQLFDPKGIASEGAGALYLEHTPAEPGAIVLETITEPALWLSLEEKPSAAQQARAALSPEVSSEALLTLSSFGHAKTDAAELSAWCDWSGPRIAPIVSIGNTMGAAIALNAVLACEHLARGSSAQAIVSATGHHHQCLAAWLRTA